MNPLVTVADTLVGRYGNARTWRVLGYLACALPLGILTFSLVALVLALGLSTLVIGVGVVVLAGGLVLARRCGGAEVRLVNKLFGARIEVATPAVGTGSWQRQVLGELASGPGWKAMLWFVLRLPLGVFAMLAILVPPLIGLGLISAGLTGVLADANAGYRLIGLLGGVAALLPWPHLLLGTAALHTVIARGLLGVSARERLAEARQRTAVAETRTDLARELHDSVGHSLTATLMQARAARRQLATDPAQADQALATIEEQNRLALDELDQVLAALRDESCGERGTRGLADVPELVAATRGSGQPVTLHQSGPHGQVSASVDRAVYRVVQEALTNVARHAPGSATQVSTAVADGLVRVAVRNAPGGVVVGTRDGGGTGLAGLAERVQRLGGQFCAGPAPDGFLVQAELPAGRTD